MRVIEGIKGRGIGEVREKGRARQVQGGREGGKAGE